MCLVAAFCDFGEALPAEGAGACSMAPFIILAGLNLLCESTSQKTNSSAAAEVS